MTNICRKMLVYCNQIIDNLPGLRQFIVTLASLATRDYNKSFGLSDQVSALNLDQYEHSASGIHDRTMDAAIGIADYINNRMVSPRLQLIELRLGYINANNPSLTEMKRKVSHSEGLLRQIFKQTTIDNHPVFIFTEKVAPLFLNRVKREAKTDASLKYWLVQSPAEFNQMIVFSSDVYQPITPIDEITERFNAMVSNHEISKAMEQLGYWRECCHAFQLRYKLRESELLLDMLHDWLQTLDNAQLNNGQQQDLLFYHEYINELNLYQQNANNKH